MKLAILIATYGRAAQVERLLAHLAGQHRLPDEVVLSVADPSHAAVPAGLPFPTRVVTAPAGLCLQRNAALDAALGRFDVVTFLDDDFVPAHNYLSDVLAAFEAGPDLAVVMGHVILDGASNAGVDWKQALTALAEDAHASAPRELVDQVGAYGCNMSLRATCIGEARFDPRLVLYGWQEDIDFTSRLRAHGRVVCARHLHGVHLGLKAGRVSGTRFGYSQVVNPVYLIRKGSVPASFLLPLMLRNLAANLARSIRPEPYVDRRGRLRGNLIGIGHLLTGRIEPEFAARLT